MYLLLAFAYQWLACHILSLIPFPTINNISASVFIGNDAFNLHINIFHV